MFMFVRQRWCFCRCARCRRCRCVRTEFLSGAKVLGTASVRGEFEWNKPRCIMWRRLCTFMLVDCGKFCAKPLFLHRCCVDSKWPSVTPFHLNSLRTLERSESRKKPQDRNRVWHLHFDVRVSTSRQKSIRHTRHGGTPFGGWGCDRCGLCRIQFSDASQPVKSIDEIFKVGRGGLQPSLVRPGASPITLSVRGAFGQRLRSDLVCVGQNAKWAETLASRWASCLCWLHGQHSWCYSSASAQHSWFRFANSWPSSDTTIISKQAESAQWVSYTWTTQSHPHCAGSAWSKSVYANEHWARQEQAQHSSPLNLIISWLGLFQDDHCIRRPGSRHCWQSLLAITPFRAHRASSHATRLFLTK